MHLLSLKALKRKYKRSAFRNKYLRHPSISNSSEKP